MSFWRRSKTSLFPTFRSLLTGLDAKAMNGRTYLSYGSILSNSITTRPFRQVNPASDEWYRCILTLCKASALLCAALGIVNCFAEKKQLTQLTLPPSNQSLEDEPRAPYRFSCNPKGIDVDHARVSRGAADKKDVLLGNKILLLIADEIGEFSHDIFPATDLGIG